VLVATWDVGTIKGRAKKPITPPIAISTALKISVGTILDRDEFMGV
jgi:hypothetical protein